MSFVSLPLRVARSLARGTSGRVTETLFAAVSCLGSGIHLKRCVRFGARRPQLTALVLHLGVDFHLERSKVLKRNSQKSLSPEAGIATGKSEYTLCGTRNLDVLLF